MNAALEPCPVVSGKYALHRVLGSGGAATVYEAENLLVGRRVALKLLSPKLARLPALCAAFLAEARVAARIGHPNVADILDIGLDRSGCPYIVMELLEGETLQEVLTRRGPLPVPYACELMLQVLAAIDAAHAVGIVHRDLKPANVIVTHPHPDEPRVKVLDFGIAQGLIDAEDSQLAAVRWAGTPLYMAPEQGLGNEVDARADVYSASVMLYELLTGALPYEAETVDTLLMAALGGRFVPLRHRNPSLPEALARWIEAGLAGRRERRLGTVRELAEGLAAFVSPGRCTSIRSSGAHSGSPIPLVDHRHDAATSWRVIGLASPLSERALSEPRFPAAPPTPRLLHASEPADHAPPAPRRRHTGAALLALAVGFAAGLGAAWAAGLV